MDHFITKNNDIQQIKWDYDQRCIHYKALGNLIRIYLIESLSSSKISFTDIQFRIKTFHSFFSKIKRRKYYDDPYEKIEDICGVRVICTFKEDLEKVSELISTLFEAKPAEIKGLETKSESLGYRGLHQTVNLKSEICNSSPFYKKLQGLKAEIQVRTIVEHSWAEVSHKLNYKDEENIPKEFQSKLLEISYNLALVDRLYNALKKEKEDLKKKLKSKNKKTFSLEQEINIETVLIFLDIFFSGRDNNDDIELLIEDILDNNFSFKNIIDRKEELGNIRLLEIEKELLGTSRHSQVGIVRLILSLYYPKYWEERKRILPLYFDGKKRIKIIENWQKKIENEKL